jgi:hypothetical protein
LSDSFPIQNGLKQGDALLTLLFNFALKYAIRKVKEKQVGSKLNGTNQLLAYVYDVNLPGDNIDTIKKHKQTNKQTPWSESASELYRPSDRRLIKKNTETLIDASKEVDLEINVEKTKYMLLSRHQTVG